MPLLGGEVQLKNTTLDVVLLAKNTRIPTTRTLTLAANASEAATTISVTASASVAVKAGNSLSFLMAGVGRAQALVTEDVTIGTSATDVTVSELTTAITSGATSTYFEGLRPVYGLQDFSVQSQDQTVDTTNTLSGFGTEMALVRSGKTMSISIIQVPLDVALYNIIKPVCLTGALFGREIYAVFTNPDGERMRGAAKCQNFNQPGNQNEVKKGSFELTFMGSTFVYESPHV